MINSGNSGGTITIYIYSGAPYPAGRDYSQSITKSQYTDVVSRLSGWMDSAGYFPNYFGINTPRYADLSPSMILCLFSQVLIQYGETEILPSYVGI